MRQFKNVFMFEFLEMIQKKAVITTTIIMALIAFGVTFIPTIFLSDDSDGGAVVVDDVYFSHLVFVQEDSYYPLDTLEMIVGEDLNVVGDEDEAHAMVEDGDYEKAVILTGPDSYKLITLDRSTFDNDEAMLSGVLVSLAQSSNLSEQGIDPQVAFEAMDVTMNVEYELLGKDSSQGFFVAYVVMFILYTLILFFGQSVSTSIAREKDSRTMELLITSTTTKDLIIGKVMAMGLAGVIQISIIIAFAVFGFFINQSSFPPELLEMFTATLSFDVVLVYVVFSILGYILYLYIYAALGSLVSKVEDVGSAVTPITLLFVLAFIVASMALNIPDNNLIVLSSFVPFISLFTMPIRYMLTTVASWQLILSLALMVVCVVLIQQLSIYIYRMGSLNYGKRIRIGTIFKNLLKKKN